MGSGVRGVMVGSAASVWTLSVDFGGLRLLSEVWGLKLDLSFGVRSWWV